VTDKPDIFSADTVNDWCAGCGDFGILRALEKSLQSLDLTPDDVTVLGGIGCSGKTPYYLNSYGIHTLHGRVLPFATGVKLARPSQTVVAIAGDGDGLGIGVGHMVNAGRRNLDITYIIFNNEVYGLTKGQAAPTLRLGEQTKAMSGKSLLSNNNPVQIALASGFGWIGRGYSYNVKQMVSLISDAIRYPGTSFLEILQPCPTYNDLHTKKWFAGQDKAEAGNRFYSLQDEGFEATIKDESHRVERMAACLTKAQEWGDRIPVGVFFEDRGRAEFTALLNESSPGYIDCAPATMQPQHQTGRYKQIVDALHSMLVINSN
jgi:2-oxoglutarate ferredoxin oxidoreductase subunit beta